MALVRIQDSCGNWVIINTAVGVTAEDLGLGNVQSDLTYDLPKIENSSYAFAECSGL